MLPTIDAKYIKLAKNSENGRMFSGKLDMDTDILSGKLCFIRHKKSKNVNRKIARGMKMFMITRPITKYMKVEAVSPIAK